MTDVANKTNTVALDVYFTDSRSSERRRRRAPEDITVDDAVEVREEPPSRPFRRARRRARPGRDRGAAARGGSSRALPGEPVIEEIELEELLPFDADPAATRTSACCSRCRSHLGRARPPSLTIRELLALGPGSILQLDRHAGEPVDVLVNGKRLARGEVVVIDEDFGIRVTEVVTPEERISGMGR